MEDNSIGVFDITIRIAEVVMLKYNKGIKIDLLIYSQNRVKIGHK